MELISVNEVVFFIVMVGGLGAGLLALRLGKAWLYAYILTIILYVNITEAKVIEVFGLPITLGTALYGAIFFATDLITEYHGKKSAFQIVRLSIAATILFQLFLLLTRMTLPIEEVAEVSDAMDTVFSSSLRIVVASIVTFTITQNLDIWLYDYIHRKTGDSHLWLRNNGSTLVSQGVDSYLFTFLAFYGVFDQWLLMATVAYGAKIFVALNDTAFIYLARYVVPKKEANGEALRT